VRARHDEGALVNATSFDVFGAFGRLRTTAVRHDRPETLLARGADPNGRVCCSGTPVGVAFGVGDREMVKLLGRHGGVVYATNAGYYRDTTLAPACSRTRARAGSARERWAPPTTLAEALLESGATGADLEIVRMALAQINWPLDDDRWYWR
jgi:hypothetical protein